MVDAQAPHDWLERATAFVSGGSSGIGLGITRALLERGCRVCISYQTPDHRDSALDLLSDARDRVMAIQLDVRDRQALADAASRVTERFGKLHILVCNAGVAEHAHVTETLPDTWDWMVDVNLTGAFNTVQAFLPGMLHHGERGHILTTASLMGLMTFGRSVAYSATKYAVVGMTEALRADLAGSNLGTSVLCPGITLSRLDQSRRNCGGGTGFMARSAAGADPRHDRRIALDPLDVGRAAIRGITRGDLYILTNPEFTSVLEDRADTIRRSLCPDPASLERTAMASERAKLSIYAAERARLIDHPLTKPE